MQIQWGTACCVRRTVKRPVSIMVEVSRQKTAPILVGVLSRMGSDGRNFNIFYLVNFFVLKH